MDAVIKRMTPRRWAKFGRHVPVGSEVRGTVPGCEWHGIILENYPWAKEEFFAQECDPGYDRHCMNQLHHKPVMRYQNVTEQHESTFLVMHHAVQFLVAGQWMSVYEILHLK